MTTTTVEPGDKVTIQGTQSLFDGLEGDVIATGPLEGFETLFATVALPQVPMPVLIGVGNLIVTEKDAEPDPRIVQREAIKDTLQDLPIDMSRSLFGTHADAIADLPAEVDEDEFPQWDGQTILEVGDTVVCKKCFESHLENEGSEEPQTGTVVDFSNEYVRVAYEVYGITVTRIFRYDQILVIRHNPDLDMPAVDMSSATYDHSDRVDSILHALQNVPATSCASPDWAAESGMATEAPRTALDTQEGGDHYKSYKIQPVEFCHANGIPAIEASIIKYAVRHRNKNGAEDIRKIIHYAKLLLQLEYGETLEEGAA